ncbi:MurR/RpiR family transcriptional regulator [Sinisalibacter aestuarii]|uniref:RpiR family transcriptional regulator n=1 Tax=Sinisalibacter aestuarii TaxID=2949426 RepID=A0ABQ5LU16_9RHOB|nr:MurR/RpiR family transcriptional regulator [Sinisalibacter aestuarii]GKY88471.1 RpiR family transcriptional regulator [Sinisalibacter aestuarii]
MSVLTILKAKLGTFTEGEREIAQFVLDAPDRTIQLSSANLAEATGRSQSSVVKFCQKLGFSGYQDFKLAVSQAMAQSWEVPTGVIHGSIDATDSYTTTVQKLIGSKLHAMQQTISVNTETAIGRAIEMIRNARRVQLVGVGAASLVARDLAYKLQKLGLFVIYEADSHVQVANAATLGPDDVMIALSQSGASLETLHVARTAKAHGSTLISVTGVQPNRLASMADVQLHTVADEERPRSSAITSRDAQLTMTDLLFILLLQRKPEANALIHAAEEAVTGLKS